MVLLCNKVLYYITVFIPTSAQQPKDKFYKYMILLLPFLAYFGHLQGVANKGKSSG